MKIFITSSWINYHAVILLQEKLQDGGAHEVSSFVDDNESGISSVGVSKDHWNQSIDFGKWAMSQDGQKVFSADLENLRNCDAVVVLEPAGRDAWAHAGYAHRMGKSVYGLMSKARKVGLCRLMATWFEDIDQMVVVMGQQKKEDVVEKLKAELDAVVKKIYDKGFSLKTQIYAYPTVIPKNIELGTDNMFLQVDIPH